MKFYGLLDNRIEENRMFCDTIEVGTGVTEYYWSDRHAYEVIAVKDQKHVTIREYDHKKADDRPYSNNWELISNPDKPEIDIVRRGKYWYSVVSITPDEAQRILDHGDVYEKMWACEHGFILPDIAGSGKVKRKYHRMNISFGVADYYFDYEF